MTRVPSRAQRDFLKDKFNNSIKQQTPNSLVASEKKPSLQIQ
jgi:hypothetical protein